MVLLTSGVRVLEVGIEAFVHELDHLVHSAGLDIIHKFLQAGLHAERQVLLRSPSALEILYVHVKDCTIKFSKLMCNAVQWRTVK